MTDPYILFDEGPAGPPALFQGAQQHIVAHEAADVPAALAAMAAAQTAGSWLAGYASYELGYALEDKLNPLTPAGRRTPMIRFGVFNGPDEAGAAATLTAEAGAASLADLSPVWDQARYQTAFDVVMAHIRAGDFYQANLTIPLKMRRSGKALALYQALRRAQPVRYGALVALDPTVTLLSRSPELFFRLDADRVIETAPMKGTAPRAPDPARDRALRDALGRDKKNMAENLMIVDLLRNDIGRVAEIGSVKTPELFTVETYETVHQMVSRIVGRLRRGVTLAVLFQSLFPCGSITGAPKIAAMQAIRALEAGPRDAYCGAIGWIAPDGSARFNVAIRTLALYGQNEVVLNVGGGVVADSTAASEYQEALWKARFVTSLMPT